MAIDDIVDARYFCCCREDREGEALFFSNRADRRRIICAIHINSDRCKRGCGHQRHTLLNPIELFNALGTCRGPEAKKYETAAVLIELVWLLFRVDQFEFWRFQ